jgi:hypothetical protein
MAMFIDAMLKDGMTTNHHRDWSDDDDDAERCCDDCMRFFDARLQPSMRFQCGGPVLAKCIDSSCSSNTLAAKSFSFLFRA